MKKMLSSLLLALTLVFTSCTGGSGGPYVPSSIGSNEANWFVDTLNYDAGVYDFALAKYATEQYDGWVVVYDSLLGEYTAVNVWNYDENYEYADNYFSNNGVYVYHAGYDLYGNDVYSDLYGNLFEQTSSSKKDLEKIAHNVEKVNLKKVENFLVADYGLSEKRAFQVAKLAQGWKKASKSRAMTDGDSKVFFKEVLGFSASEGLNAFKKSLEGNTSDLDALLVKAADANGTSPEHMKDIMSSVLTK